MNKYAFYKYKKQYIKIGYQNKFITYVKFVKTIDCINETSKLTADTFNQLMEYIEGKRTQFNVPILILGTPFQKSVYYELLKIPYGKTISYQQLAININNPNAYRAVGNANNSNPIAIIVPCHRVIKNNGDFGGYAGGDTMKVELINIEKNKKST